MEIKLAENIRKFRKERSLTQEQFSEVLGVTAGAVYKWEAGLSIPDIELIVEMADFFDTSVDVLLGYEMKDNRLKETVKRLKELRRGKDRASLSEAEKALKKYPNSFQIVNEAAAMYRGFSYESGSKDDYRRALELTEQSLLLLPQNTDPEISEQTLYGSIAQIYLGLDETDKAIELLKTHNAGGMYSHKIGQFLALNDREEEAVPFLSEAMAKILSDLTFTIIGYLNVYGSRDDYDSVQAIMQWGIDLFFGLREGNKPNYFDKVNSVFLAVLACAQLKNGQEEAARESLERARKLAAFFDASPSYDESDIRFINRIEGASVHDDLGATAMESLEKVIPTFEDEAFSALWKSITEQEENRNDE